MSSRFERTGSETIFEGKFFSVERGHFRHEDGSEAVRELVGHPGAVGIVVLDGERLWLVRQPREAVGVPDLLEIPAGKLDEEGEDPLETAKRELAEEIGKQADAVGAARLVLHVARLHERGDPPLPRHRDLGRRRAPRGRGGRAHRRRGRARCRSSTRCSPRTRTPRRSSRSRGSRRAWRRGAASRCTRQGPAAPRREGSDAMAVVDARSTAPASAEPFEHLVLDFLAYLEFERGLSRNTLEAYRSDLLQYGAYLNGPRPAGRHALGPRRLRLLARRRRRREAAGRARDAAAQGRVPALVPPPPAPPGHPRRRPDGEPARAQAEPAAAARALARRGREAARAAARHRAAGAARPGAARVDVRVRAARVGGDRPRDDGPRPRGRDPARARQGLQGADRAGRLGGHARGQRLPGARARAARRRPARVAPVRQPSRHRPDAPGPLQDRPAPRGHRPASRTG